jgi:hypothetical protein
VKGFRTFLADCGLTIIAIFLVLILLPAMIWRAINLMTG